MPGVFSVEQIHFEAIIIVGTFLLIEENLLDPGTINLAIHTVINTSNRSCHFNLYFIQRIIFSVLSTNLKYLFLGLISRYLDVFRLVSCTVVESQDWKSLTNFI